MIKVSLEAAHHGAFCSTGAQQYKTGVCLTTVAAKTLPHLKCPASTLWLAMKARWISGNIRWWSRRHIFLSCFAHTECKEERGSGVWSYLRSKETNGWE